MIERSVSDILRKYASWFPVVSVTGPRQSGKSTLVQSVFSDYSYVNLELPGDLEAANTDPLGFIRSHPAPLIIDEAQLAPELFNVIQVESDRAGTPGQYILSGSQNFLLRRQITQSLAGRVGILTLPPLSFRELACTGKAPKADDYLVRGGYPRLYNIEIPSDVYYSNYVTTYLDRDVSGLVNPQNLTLFNTFLKIIASSAGSLLNITSLANETGVTTKTMRAWLSILEQSYIVFTLQPYHANLRKRLVKTPKLYFYDTGLLCHLLGYTDALDAERSGALGPLFENLVVSELVKRHLGSGKIPELYFYRDAQGAEVDLLDMTHHGSPSMFEIKSSRTFRSSFTRHLDSVGELIGVDRAHRAVVTRCDASTEVAGEKIWSAADWLGAPLTS